MRKENEKNTVVVSEMFSNAVRREYIDVATGEKGRRIFPDGRKNCCRFGGMRAILRNLKNCPPIMRSYSFVTMFGIPGILERKARTFYMISESIRRIVLLCDGKRGECFPKNRIG